jgi:RNA polymerase sigma-70 factor, ECF subfamily
MGAEIDPRTHREHGRASRSRAALRGIRNDEFAGLLARAQAGEELAVARLFEDMQPRLLRFLGAADPSAGEDLAADVWVAVATSFTRFSGDYQAFRSWVLAIARRRLVEHRRSTDRRRTDPSDGEVFASIAAKDQTDGQVVDDMSGREAAALITQMLSEEQAEVVLLRIVGELDVADVALIMERTENWVRVTQHRALRRLSERLGDSKEVIL